MTHHADAVDAAWRASVVGIGWPVSNGRDDMSWKSYETRAKRKYAESLSRWKSHLTTLRVKIAADDLVITANTRRKCFYLGRVTGGWRYISSGYPGNAQLVNTRACDWVRVELDEVPGSLIFKRGTFNAVSNNFIRDYCKHLYNTRNRTGFKYKESTGSGDGESFFDCLTSDACEDMVALYLHRRHNYSIRPSSCKTSSQGWEFAILDVSGARAFVQVKNGKIDLKAEEYRPSKGYHAFLFTRGNVIGKIPNNMTVLSPDEMLDFLRRERTRFPSELSFWVHRFWRD
jgi:hypothetical protein